MPFNSGRVTFTRFRVTGDAPPRVDDTMLSILSEARFRESEIGAPDEVEAGFTTGVHLFDTQFTFEKNGYGNGGSGCLFALRLDTHKVPADVKKAYMVMNEQAAAAGNPTGFASKSEKREAKETANAQIREELASGKYRRSKVVPLYWDLASRTLYCGASGNTVIEHLVRHMRHSFAVELENLSAGVLAGDLIKAEGKSRDYEDLKPSAFTAAPTDRRPEDEDGHAAPYNPEVPSLPWIAKAVDLKDYLGNEFLMWLWWKSEQNKEGVGIDVAGDDGPIFVALDKALDMDCAWDQTGKQTLRGENPTRLPEAADALVTGKWPRKIGLILADREHQWELNLQGDQFVVSGAALPEFEDAQTAREVQERRLDLTTRLADVLDLLYQTFLDRRASGPWPHDRDAIKSWIKDRHPSRKRPAAAMPAPATPVGEPVAVS